MLLCVKAFDLGILSIHNLLKVNRSKAKIPVYREGRIWYNYMMMFLITSITFDLLTGLSGQS